jgi:hypothetical protein
LSRQRSPAQNGSGKSRYPVIASGIGNYASEILRVPSKWNCGISLELISASGDIGNFGNVIVLEAEQY